MMYRSILALSLVALCSLGMHPLPGMAVQNETACSVYGGDCGGFGSTFNTRSCRPSIAVCTLQRTELDTTKRGNYVNDTLYTECCTGCAAPPSRYTVKNCWF